jgi:hypothetical protein
MMQVGIVAAVQLQLQDRLFIALTVLAMLGAVVLTGVMVLSR